MRNNLIITGFYLLISMIGVANFASLDDTISINQISQTNDSTVIELVKEVKDHVIALGHMSKNENVTQFYVLIKVISIILGVITILVTIIVVWVLNLIPSLKRDSKEIQQDSKVLISEANIKIEEFLSRSNLTFNEFKSNFNKELADFEKNKVEGIEEINRNITKFRDDVEKIRQIEKELSSHRSYLHQSIENYYDLLLFFANKSGDKELLQLAFIKRAINQIYSFIEEERFTGITTLGESGTKSDIIHLNHVLFDPDELEKHKILAKDAIIKITNRK